MLVVLCVARTQCPQNEISNIYIKEAHFYKCGCVLSKSLHVVYNIKENKVHKLKIYKGKMTAQTLLHTWFRRNVLCLFVEEKLWHSTQPYANKFLKSSFI